MMKGRRKLGKIEAGDRARGVRVIKKGGNRVYEIGLKSFTRPMREVREETVR